MGSKRKPRRRAPRVWPWLVLGMLGALAVGIGSYLVQELPSARPAGRQGEVALEALQKVVGPLDPSGVRLRVRDRLEAEAVLRRLEREARNQPGVSSVEVDRASGAFHVRIAVGSRRYPVDLLWSLPTPTPAPRLAIVIDDMGRDLELARAFLDLDLPVTLSILPHLPRSEDVARLARGRHRPYLLHLPMQPQGYPEVQPGEHALLVGMDESTFLRLLRDDLEAVPGAAGVNNHMGSRLTELQRPMKWVMGELKARGLYFLDSVTTGHSVAAEAARDAGIPWARRDVFLDNVQDGKAIDEQLERAIGIARKGGRAVTIGHPHKATLEALRRWTARLREEGIRVVPLGELVQTAGEGA